MILNIRDIDMESVSKCMSGDERAFETWYESEDAKIWREPLEEQLSGRLAVTWLRDFAVAIWLQSRLAKLRAENEEAASFLPVDKKDLLSLSPADITQGKPVSDRSQDA